MTSRQRGAARTIGVAVVIVLVAALVDLAAPASAGAATLTARGSVNQVYVTGATPGATVELLDGSGAVVVSGTADEQGSYVFGNHPEDETPVPPGPGYRVRQGLARSSAVTVLDPAASTPPQSFYDGQHLDIAPAGIFPNPETGYQYLTTRDGTTLSIDVRPPLDPSLSPPYPVVVDYSGYWPSDPDPFSEDYDHRPMWVARAAGFATVGVNIRGTMCSGGAFSYWEAQQRLDGYDAIETIAAQPWASSVGMIGLSYPGISQLFVASTQPPHLAAITPLSTIADTYRTSLYPGGILNVGHASQWAAQVDTHADPSPMPWVEDRIARGDSECARNQLLHSQRVPMTDLIRDGAFYEDRFDAAAPRTFADRIEVPTYLMQAWQDEQTGADTATMIDRFTGLGGPGEPPLRVDLLNGGHPDPYGPETYSRLIEFLDFYVARKVPAVTGALRQYANIGFAQLFGAPGIDLPAAHRWPSDFDAALAEYENEPPVRVNFEVGAAGTDDRPCPDQDLSPDPCPAGYPYASFSQTFDAWPPPATTPQRWYFQPDGALAAAPPATADGSPRGQDSYLYDSSLGSPTMGNTWQQYPEHNSLSFVSPPLGQDAVMAGTGSVDLWLRSTAPDVDLEVDLTEVRPDGQETYVQSGWLRASRRALDPSQSTELRPFPTQREDDAEPLPADEFVPARVQLYPFAHVFRAGSSLRLTVKQPGGNRTLWSFAILGYDTPQQVDIAHSVGRASSVVLPLQPDVDVPVGLPACGALRSQPCRDFLPSRAPTGVAASVAGRDLSVTWQAPATEDAVTGYTVTVAPTGETFPVASSSTSFTYPSPDPGTRYSFAVTASYAAGDGPASTSSDVSPAPAGFADVPTSAWYAAGVDWTTAYGVLSGYPGGVFKATKAATRAQVASALWNLAGRPAATGDGASYSDVPAGARYHAALDWLDDAGIDSGFADGTFRPRGTLTRARLAKWMHRASGALGGSPPNTYTDVPEGARYSAAADWWQAQGLGAPSTATVFRPAATVKRSQLAGWLWNLARTDTAWGTPSPW